MLTFHHPGGMTSNSRWLSEATPQEYHRTIIPHPEGMPSHGAESLPQPTGVLCLGIRIPQIRHPRPLAAQKIQIANVKRPTLNVQRPKSPHSNSPFNV